jgi:uncharacterized membrane protein YfhO
LPPAERLGGAAVQFASYTPTSLSLRVQIANEGWLLVTDSWSLGWEARIDGRPVPIWGGNFIFRALNVRAGRNEVEFSYRPYAFPWLLLLSWATLAGTAVVSATALTRSPQDANGGKSH